ncbi:unnamed protein product [Zymoseptoria tritici ST99CH_3D7]|uniref:Uncharacterized protein n=1 Tax=Zymoseptoria tritici (strain ST99CH_3D7) TaxID=1276538 RepID=A0A1X7RYQ4_ZYMT9|nr:unnamed protein product [Zymoseptoria tritici ST99CH_3D7]
MFFGGYCQPCWTTCCAKLRIGLVARISRSQGLIPVDRGGRGSIPRFGTTAVSWSPLFGLSFILLSAGPYEEAVSFNYGREDDSQLLSMPGNSEAAIFLLMTISIEEKSLSADDYGTSGSYTQVDLSQTPH